MSVQRIEGASRLVAGAAVGMIMSLAMTVGAHAAEISVSSSQSSVAIGGTFTIFFDIAGLSSASGDSLSGFDMDVRFDPTFAALTGLSFVDSTTGLNQLDLPESGSLGFAGFQNVSGAVLDVFGLSGNSALALDANQASQFRFLSLTFAALAASSATTVSIDLLDPGLLFLDSAGDLLSTRFTSSLATVAIGAGQPVPEPGSVALLGLGLITLTLFRRRLR